MHRREVLKVIGAAAAMPLVPSRGEAMLVEESRAGRLKQSVSRWPYSKIPLPEFCRACKDMGIVAIDLLQPDDWGVVRDAGLVCSMGYPTKRQDFIHRLQRSRQPPDVAPGAGDDDSARGAGGGA